VFLFLSYHLINGKSMGRKFFILQHWHFTKSFQTYYVKTVANNYSVAYNSSELQRFRAAAR